MDCARSQELLSDHLEGTLHAILRSELDGHLAGCSDCRSLREAVAWVVESLHAFPDLEPPVGLAERVVAATRTVARPGPRPVIVRPALVIPSWMQAAAPALPTVAIICTMPGTTGANGTVRWWTARAAWESTPPWPWMLLGARTSAITNSTT